MVKDSIAQFANAVSFQKTEIQIQVYVHINSWFEFYICW